MRRCLTGLLCLLAMLLADGSDSAVGQRLEQLTSHRLASNGPASNRISQADVTNSRLASLIPASELIDGLRVNGLATPAPANDAYTIPAEDQAWAVFGRSSNNQLKRLPLVEVTPTPNAPLSYPSTGKVETHQPIANLLPPQQVRIEQQRSQRANGAAASVTPRPAPAAETVSLTVEQKLAVAVMRDCAAATTGVLTDQRVNKLAKTKIRSAYAMANRGGYYVARQELIEVLRMISHTKDARKGVPECAEALAAGLRALEEAEDFAPRGTQLEAELAIEVLCASHRTPLAKQIQFKNVLPHQMMNGYFRYSQIKLAAAVADEPAGSMALHALGKLATQLGQVEPEKHRLAQRRAIAFQQAALLAHNQNHLAAHELATLLADAGHFAEAERLLRQVASHNPNAVVLRNLSLVQKKMGLSQQAIANQAMASQLAQQGLSGTNNVQWVSPQDFSRTGGINPTPAMAMSRPNYAPYAMPTQRGPIAQPPRW